MGGWSLGEPTETSPFGAQPPAPKWNLGPAETFNPFGPEGEIGSTPGIAARGGASGVGQAAAGAMKGTAEVVNRRATFEPWYDTYLGFDRMSQDAQMAVRRTIQGSRDLGIPEKAYLQSQMTRAGAGEPMSLEEFAGLPTTQTGLYKAGAATEKATQFLTPAEQQTTTGQVATGAGAFLGTVAPAAIAGMAGQPELAAALAAGGIHAMAAGSAANAAERARAGGATEEQVSRIASQEYAVNLALMTAPVGSFLGEVKRSAPGFLPWAGAKLRQAVQTGAIFSGIGEVQDYLSQEAAREIYDPKAQYTPDERRMLVNFLSGAVVGPFGGTAVKPSPKKVADLVGHVEADHATVAEFLTKARNQEETEALKHLDEVAQMGVDALNRGLIDHGAIAFDAAAKAGKAAVPDLSDARAMRIIGEGEEGRTATAESAGAQVAAAGEHAIRRPDAQMAARSEDIHAAARQIAPDVFEPFDRLQAQHETLTQHLNELADMRDRGTSPAIEAMDRQIDDLRAQRLEAEGAEKRDMANRITALEAERANLADALPKKGDTPEMAQIRQARVQNELPMRDLAPRVTAAYREAETRTVPAGAAPVAAETRPPALTVAAERIAALEADRMAADRGERAAGSPAQSFEAIARGEIARPVDIASDAARQLQGVGRPGAEAKAAGALVDAYYRARAARLTGTTAEDLYREQGARIRAGRGATAAVVRERELAQPRRGKITLGPDRNTITMLKGADASTFIHETGHDWLEQLMRDAADPRATQELRDDAAMVHKWLGTKEGEAIPTRAHERFARGFEAYMREGRAPSAKLADVFRQFKDWLVKIYQTATQLKAPISDDIRGVFDRMLTTPEERTVIAPEREPAKTFADEHAEDARRTPPALADAARDHIEEEIDALAAQHVEWVPHEQLAGKAEGEPAATAGAPTGGAEPEPAAGRPGVPGESPALPAVGGGPGTEGAGSRAGAGEPGGARAGEGGGNAGQRPGRESDVGAANPWLIQKAANIRMENLTDSQKVIDAARQLAKENNDFLEERRGVVHDSELLDAAMSIGLDPDQINLRKLQQMSTADNMALGSRILALRILMAKAGMEDREFAAKAAVEGASDEDVMAYMQSQDRLRNIARTLAGVTAEWGRAGRGFRNLAGFREAMSRAKGAEESQTPQQRQLFQSELDRARDRAKMVAQADTHEQAMRIERNAAQTDFQRYREKARSWYLSYFINNLISGPFTHLGYGIGNTVWNQFKITVDTSGAAAIGSYREMMGFANAEDRVYWGEVGAQLFASYRGFREGIGVSGKALRTGIPFMKGDMEGMARRQKAEDATVAEGIARDSPEFDARVRELAAQRPQQVLPGKVGYAFETPSRLVTAIHTVFYSMNYATEIARLAYRTAAMEGHEIGGDDFNNRVAQITASPERVMQNRVGKDGETEQVPLMQIAHEEALRAVLMEKPMFGTWQYNLQRAVNQNIAAKTVMPFMQIGMNILREGYIDHTPLGFVSQRVRDNMSGKNGAAARDTQIAKMGIGIGISLAVMGATAEGILTDGGPTDPERRARKLAEGWLPYAIKIGNFYVPYRKYLGPLGPLVAGASNMYSVGHLMATTDASTAAHAMVFGFSEAIVDETWMRGVSDFMQAVKSREGVVSGQYFRNLASDFVPWAVGMGQVAREIDPYSRQVHTLTDALLNKIPFASKTLEPRIDIWGDPIPGRTIMSPSLDKSDPTMDALDRLDFKPASLQRKIRGQELTDAQYADYGRMAGRSSKMILDQIVREPGFALVPPEIQKKMITKVIDDSREVARSRVMMDSGRGKYGGPETDIIKRSLEARRKLLQPAPGTAPE